MNPLDLSIATAFLLKGKKSVDSLTVSQLLMRMQHKDLDSISGVVDFLRKNQVDTSAFTEKHWSTALQQIEANLSSDIRPIPINSGDYPPSLRVIDDPPPVLFVKGNLETLKKLPGVSVVGARESSANGEIIAERVSEYLSNQGWIIVSGLALGIDAAAHRGALLGNKITIAVLAHGLEKASPKTNSNLAMQILEQGGLWVSEHSVGVPAKKEHFVPRNRLQIGLSAGSIIVEAKLSSGSITQAKFCVKQGRPLFAVLPESTENKLGLVCEGTEYIVKEFGAIPVRTRHDYPKVLSKLQIQKEVMQGIESK